MLLKRIHKIIVRAGFATFLINGTLFAGKVEDAMKSVFSGFVLYQKAEGDLNSDGVDDYVAILWNGD